MASQSIYIEIPGSDIKLYPGYKIKLNRFDSDIWTVHYGWFDFSGNRPIMGWYLTNDSDCNSVKPIQKIDLYDIYVVDTSNKEDIDVETIQSDYAQSNPLEPSYIKNRPFYEDVFDGIDNVYFENIYDEFVVGSDTIHQWTFNDIYTDDITADNDYNVSYTVDGETIEFTATAIIPASNMIVLADSAEELYLLIGGKISTDGEMTIYVPQNNTVSVCVGNMDKPDVISVSVENVKFKYLKQISSEMIGKSKYKYVTYPREYMSISATELSDTSVMLSVKVPVAGIDDNGKIHYVVTNGIRMGMFAFGGTLPSIQIYADLFPKDQEWDLWTYNNESQDGSYLRISVPYFMMSTIGESRFTDHIKYCGPLIKGYMTDDSSEIAPIWAGYEIPVHLDSTESTADFIDYIAGLANEQSSTISLTVKLRDIDYVTETATIAELPTLNKNGGDGE